MHKYRFFNTNNLWVNLPALKRAFDEAGGLLPLPVIKNAKTVDPRDKASTKERERCYSGRQGGVVWEASMAGGGHQGRLLQLGGHQIQRE